MARQPSGPPSPTFEIPDLELESPTPPAPRPAASRHPSGARAIQVPDLELDATSIGPAAVDFEAGSRLELDTSGTIASVPPLGPYGSRCLEQVGVSGDFDLDEALLEVVPIATVVEGPWPRGRSADASALRIDPAVVKQCAGYADSRVPPHLTPSYAFRVWSRRRELRAELATWRSELARREARRDQHLVNLVTALRPALQRDERFSELLAEFGRAEAELERHERSVALAHQDLSAALLALDRQMAPLEAKREKQHSRLAEEQARHESARVEFERLRAKLKRLEIQARNVKQRARALLGPAGGMLPAALAAELAELEGQRLALEPSVEAGHTRLEAAATELASCQNSLAETTQAIEELRSEKRAAVRTHEGQSNRKQERHDSAAQNHTRVGLRIAHAVLDLRGGVAVGHEELEAIRVADDAALQAQLELEKRVLALDAYHRKSFDLGWKLVLALPALVVLLLVLRWVL